jgi:hypothetical protein
MTLESPGHFFPTLTSDAIDACLKTERVMEVAAPGASSFAEADVRKARE